VQTHFPRNIGISPLLIIFLFQTKSDDFFDLLQSLIDGLSLGLTAAEYRTFNDIHTVFISFQKDRKQFMGN
jgi:hypothetical protein